MPAGTKCSARLDVGTWNCSSLMPPGLVWEEFPCVLKPRNQLPFTSAALLPVLALPALDLDSDLTSNARGVIVLVLRSCSYQAGSSSPWEQSSCELWMHRVCLRPFGSGSVPWQGSHTHLSDPFWQHPLLTASPSPLPSGYLEYRKYTAEWQGAKGCGKETSHLLGGIFNAKNHFCLISNSLCCSKTLF